MKAYDEEIKKLIDQNTELENYFRNTIIPQLFVDRNLVLRKFTPPAMKQFKLAGTDVGKSINDILDNFRYPSIIENIQTVIESNEILEKEIQTTDFRWYQMNILPYIQKQDNQTNGVIITFVDITYRINDLKEQEKLISDHEVLLDTISHDIKSPLTNLVLAIDQFKAMNLEDQQAFESLLEIVERALSKMKTLIDDLTAAGKDRHRYQSHSERLNIEHIVEDVRLTLNDNIKSSGTVIKMDIQVSEITFSRRKLRSIIYNLISNSIKYSSPHRAPEIIIQTVSDGDEILISVKDNGIGIEKNKQDQVFSKYFCAKNDVEGSGVGLYLVKQLVVNAGGKIAIESEVDKGTTIQIFLKAG